MSSNRVHVDHRRVPARSPGGAISVDVVRATAPSRARPSRRPPAPAPRRTPRRTGGPRPGRRPRARPSTAAAIVAGVPGRGQVADVPVDPVADQLHPAVAGGGLLGDRAGGTSGAGYLDADVAQVAPRRRDVAAGPGQPGHVRVGRPAPGTGRASRRRGGPAPRRPGRPRPAPGPRRPTSIGRPAGRMPMWQWASTRPGRMNPVPASGDRVRYRLVRVTRSPTSQRSRTSSSGQEHPPDVPRHRPGHPRRARSGCRTTTGRTAWCSLVKSSFGGLKPAVPGSSARRVEARRQRRHAARDAGRRRPPPAALRRPPESPFVPLRLFFGDLVALRRCRAGPSCRPSASSSSAPRRSGRAAG